MAVKIYLASDLHFEAWGWNHAIDVPGDADITVIAGDLHYMPEALEIIGKTADMYEIPIIYVSGNHEYYHHDYEAMNELAQNYEHKNVHVLINQAVEIKGIRFVGTPLWTNFRAFGESLQADAMQVAQNYINDFRLIKLNEKMITPEVMLGWHQHARDFLTVELSKPFDGKTVVVTHFPPSYSLCHEQFIGEQLSPYFNPDCDEIIKTYQPTAWFYGHTHTGVEKVVHGVPMFTNMGGYPNERLEVTGFDHQKLITL